ncbi:MAG TPA: hypothetical protein VHV55_26555 [Pirellulales bacterium]|jgi:hypothetical protein|nr:hypothetical protein [Pirellulales bacterium]
MTSKTKSSGKSQEAATPQTCVRTTQDDATFDVLTSDILGKLSFARVSLLSITNEKFAREIRHKNRRDMIAAFVNSLQELKRFQRDWDVLLDAVVDAFVWKGRGDSELRLYRKALEDARKALPRPSLELADPLVAELMVGSDDEAKNALGAAVRDSATRMTSAFHASLDEMRRQQIIGAIEWLSKDVCKYHFYRIRRIEKKIGESKRTESGGRTEDAYFGEWREIEKTYQVNHIGRFDVLERHEHHLFNAARFQYPAPTLRKPTFINAFLKGVPPWVQKYIFISEGDMLREDVTKHEREVERFDTEKLLSSQVVRSGRLWSPAVSLGTFVLTGWSTSDLG